MMNFSSLDNAYAFGECENDVCLDTTAGYVCADYTQIPGSEDGRNCDVGPQGESCNSSKCQ